MLKGAKRYILAPPTECKGLSIIKEKAHPSYRHSLNDWTDPKEPLKDPKFAEVMAIDTIVHEGTGGCFDEYPCKCTVDTIVHEGKRVSAEPGRRRSGVRGARASL